MKSQNPNTITEGTIWKQLLLFFFPILMGSFFQQMYNTVDTIIVGRFIGTQALAAVGSSASLITLVNGFFIGLSSGATVILSQHYGAGNSQGSTAALHTGLLLSLILGVLTMSIGLAFGPDILVWIRTPENCMEQARIYLSVYFTGAVASMVYNMGTGILRAMGDSRRPMHYLMVCCGLNILLDILLVAVWDMGVAGAALATVFSQVISAVLVVAALTRLPEECRLRWKQLRLHAGLLRQILVIGVPAGLQFMTYDFSNLISQSSINSFGDTTAAAWIAYIKTDYIIWMVITAFGVAITTFVGQNYGAGKWDRVKKSIGICLGISTGIVLVLSALEVVFRTPLLGIYTTDPQVIQTGAYIILRTVPFCCFFIPVEVLGGAMRGCGYSMVPTAITMVFACAFRVLWVTFVVERWHSLLLLIACYPVSWLLCAIVFGIVYLRGNWLKATACPAVP